MPLRLQMVLASFLIEGGYALWVALASLLSGDGLLIRPDVIWLAVGIGLFLRIQGWRILALLLLPLFVIYYALVLLLVQFGSYNVSVSFMRFESKSFVVAWLCTFIALRIWQYWMLAAHSVKPLFRQHWSEK